MQLRTQAKNGSMISMTVGAGGVPKFIGNGKAKAVVTGDVVDNDRKCIGYLYEMASKAVAAWELLLVDYGFLAATKGPPRYFVWVKRESWVHASYHLNARLAVLLV